MVKGSTDIEKLICYEISGACDGVDLKKKRTHSKYADIDLSGQSGEESVSKVVHIDPETKKGFAVDDDSEKGLYILSSMLKMTSN